MNVFGNLGKLLDALATCYTDKQSAQRIAQSAGLPVIEIEFSGRARDNWWNIAQVAAYIEGAMEKILGIARKDFPEVALFKVQAENGSGVVTATRSPVESHPGTSGGGLVRPAALPYDNTGKSDWFGKTMELSKGVALVKCSQGMSTGFLLPDKLMLVPSFLANEQNYKRAECIFDYDKENVPVKKYAFDPNFILRNEKLFYTILKINKPFLPIEPLPVNTNYTFTHEANMEVISHPLGKAKKMASGTLKHQWDHRIFYDTETTGGSSGAPIIHNFSVIAMHVANGKRSERYSGGIEINEQGDRKPYQMGISIKAILDDAGLSF